MREIQINPNDGYVFNEQSEKLEFFKYEKAVFNFESGIVKYFGKLGGVDSEITNAMRYKSEEDFKRGITTNDTQTIKEEWLQRKGLRFIFKDGKAEEISQDADYEMGKSIWKVQLANGERAYNSIEEVYDFNDIVVKDEDGTERVVKCAAKKVELTDKQKMLVEQFNELVSSMVQEGIGFIHDESSGDIMVINKELIKCIEVDCERYSDEGWTDILRMYKPTKLSCAYCNDDLYVNAEFSE